MLRTGPTAARPGPGPLTGKPRACWSAGNVRTPRRFSVGYLAATAEFRQVARPTYGLCPVDRPNGAGRGMAPDGLDQLPPGLLMRGGRDAGSLAPASVSLRSLQQFKGDQRIYEPAVAPEEPTVGPRSAGSELDGEGARWRRPFALGVLRRVVLPHSLLRVPAGFGRSAELDGRVAIPASVIWTTISEVEDQGVFLSLVELHYEPLLSPVGKYSAHTPC